MMVRFTKMHGLGNDFVVIDAVRQPVKFDAEHARFIANRRFGIGCDQILLVEPPPPGAEAVDFAYRIFNSDGGEVEQCGNGARCLARFVRDEGLSDKDHIRVHTHGGVITLTIEGNGQITADMGVPRFEPGEIPFRAEARAEQYTIEIDGHPLDIGAVSMGNPHAVLTVANVDDAPVASLGPAIEVHARFPHRVNVGFMEIADRGHIRLRVHERGAGETLACGTGACAAVVVGRVQGRLDDKVEVDLPGGQLHIAWEGEGAPVWMTGPATTVFHGTIEL